MLLKTLCIFNTYGRVFSVATYALFFLVEYCKVTGPHYVQACVGKRRVVSHRDALGPKLDYHTAGRVSTPSKLRTFGPCSVRISEQLQGCHALNPISVDAPTSSHDISH